MAGNNSCGSRSIDYGNMVHNVLGIDAMLADGSEIAFRPGGADAARRPRGAASSTACGDRARASATRSQRRCPKVLRRVGGYNLDIFDPQSERPYTDDGTRQPRAPAGRLRRHARVVAAQLTLKLAPLPRAQDARRRQLPDVLRRRWTSAQHIVELSPTAVELVDRTMIDLARANPAFRPVIERALIGEPEAILLVEFAGDDAAPRSRSASTQLVELMGDLGLPGRVVEMTDAARAEGAVGGAQGRPQHHDEHEGRRQAGVLHRGLRGAARAPRRLHRPADRGVPRSTARAAPGTRTRRVGTLHVRPILDMRRDGAAKMRAIAEEATALVREYKGAYSGEHGDGLCRGEWVAWQFGPRLNARVRRDQGRCSIRSNRMNPGKIVASAEDGRRALFPLRARATASAASRPRSTGRRGTCSAIRCTEHETGARHRRRRRRSGFAKAVEMCNNNGHCRKFDAGTMCPSYRVTRDEQHLTRGRANTLRLALSGQLGAGRARQRRRAATRSTCACRCKGCQRECPTGVDMAKMKIECARGAGSARTGCTLQDRLIAFLPRYAPCAAPRAVACQPARTRSGLPRWLGERWLGLSRAALAAALARDTFLRDASASRRRSAPRERQRSRALRRHVQQLLRAGERARRARGAARPPATACTCNARRQASGRCAAAAPSSRRAWSTKRSAKRGARSTRCCRYVRARRRRSSASSRRACCRCATSSCAAASARKRASCSRARVPVRGVPRAREQRPDACELPLKPLAATRALLHGHCHQKAFDACRAGADGAAAGFRGWQSTADRIELLRDGGQLRLRGRALRRLDGDGGAVAAARGARRRRTATLIVADGTSCRHQIHDGAGREAMHVARVLERALA